MVVQGGDFTMSSSQALLNDVLSLSYYFSICCKSAKNGS